MNVVKNFGLAALVAAGTMLAAPAHAIVITSENDANALANALLAGGGAGIDLSSVTVSVSGHNNGVAYSTGVYTNASNTYGIGNGIVLSSGDVSDYGDGANTASGNSTVYGVAATAAEEAILDPITGGSFNHNDVTSITLTFNMLAGFDSVYFNVVFGSDEYPEWAGSSFIDAFGLFVNGTNVAFANGAPININNPGMGAPAGTELDGVLGGSTGEFGQWVHTFGTFVGDGAQNVTVTFIIADSGDAQLDSVAYISQLGGSEPPVEVPVPATLALFGLGLAALRARRK